MKTFDNLNKKLFLYDIRSAFNKKKIPISSCFYLNERVVIITKSGDTIKVFKESNIIKWTLNALSKGQVFGNELIDVAGDYQFEILK